MILGHIEARNLEVHPVKRRSILLQQLILVLLNRNVKKNPKPK